MNCFRCTGELCPGQCKRHCRQAAVRNSRLTLQHYNANKLISALLLYYFIMWCLLHPFNCLFSRTIWVSWYQKGNTSLELNEARDGGVLGWQWHQLDHMQTICISLQTDNHTNTSSLNFYRPNQQCQSTKGSSSCDYEQQIFLSWHFKIPTFQPWLLLAHAP